MNDLSKERGDDEDATDLSDSIDEGDLGHPPSITFFYIAALSSDD